MTNKLTSFGVRSIVLIMLYIASVTFLVSSSLVYYRNQLSTSSTKKNEAIQKVRITANGRRVPAEWEPHESIWMAWPTYNNKHDWDAEGTYAKLLQTLIKSVSVDLCVTDAMHAKQVQTYLCSQGIAATQFGKRIRFRVVGYGDIWLRDTGPVFVEAEGERAAVDFGFNCWGWGGFVKDTTFASFVQQEEGVDRSIAKLTNAASVKSSLILEGGALEFNGNGTVIVSEDVVFQRNPTWSKAKVETEFQRLFGTRKVIWLKGFVGNDAHPVMNAPYQMNRNGGVQSVYTLMTTNGHTDEFVRFTGTNSILLAKPPSAEEAAKDPIAACSRKTLLEAHRILSSATDADGNPLQLKWMPEARSLFVTIDKRDEIYKLLAKLDFKKVGKTTVCLGKKATGVLASSYLNYLVTNKLVLVAQYQSLDRRMASTDAEAISVLQQAFPGRQVVGFDCRAINVGGGGIHCITQQLPKLMRSKVGSNSQATTQFQFDHQKL